MERQSSLTRASVLLAILLSPLLVLAQNNPGEVLTNDKVMTMTRAGLPTSIIVNKIRSTRTNFNTSTEELIRLQQARIPAEIINAMVEAASNASTVTSRTGAGDVSKTDPHDPASAHEAGIYLLHESEGRKLMTQLEPSVSTQSKSGGFFKSALTYGIAKIKSKAVLSNSNARLQIS